ncbi:MAG: low molecular weight phosphatase family protein [Planctomycetaceae bacterium]|nr:low molecular weight phosphatase family protein [Planctomycetaceae bacterium]
MKTILFLCTGNYYRSRFAEMYFRHLVTRLGLPWQVESRGLQLDPGNEGPISTLTIQECKRLRVLTGPLRWPLELVEEDLACATVTIAVKETEHRPLIQKKFPTWEDRIVYWNIHDVDFATADEALPMLRQQVIELVERLMPA